MKYRIKIIECDLFDELRRAGKSMRGYGKYITRKMRRDQVNDGRIFAKGIVIGGISHYAIEHFPASTSKLMRKK